MLAAATCRREREREREQVGVFTCLHACLHNGKVASFLSRQTVFHGTVQLDRMALITSLEIPRMFGDEKLCYEGIFWKVVKTQSFRPQWNLVHVIRPHAQVFKKKYNFFHCPWIFWVFALILWKIQTNLAGASLGTWLCTLVPNLSSFAQC